VGLDDAAGAVVKNSGWGEILREEKACLSLKVTASGRSVHSISHGIGSEGCSDGARGSLLGLLRISWPNYTSKARHCIFGH
jgi:hypothetical protein